MNLSTVPFVVEKPVNTRLPNPVATGGTAKLFDEYAKQTSLSAQVMPDEHAKLTKQAQKWVATTFFGAILKQMRESPFKSELSTGGRGGESFATMLDQRLADKMARGSGSKLVNAIVRKLEAAKAYNKQQGLSIGSAGAEPARIPAMIQTAGEVLRNSGRAHVAPGF